MIDLGKVEDYLRAVQQRAKALCLTEAEYAAARNPGDRRTPKKRELLRRIVDRCREAGIEPLPARYWNRGTPEPPSACTPMGTLYRPIGIIS